MPAHGGVREGAGRKAEKGKTKVMRVPEAFAPAIKQLIEQLAEQSAAGIPNTSSSMFLRDLLGRGVDLEIKTNLRT